MHRRGRIRRRRCRPIPTLQDVSHTAGLQGLRVRMALRSVQLSCRTIHILYTYWKWINELNRPYKPARPVWPIIPFPMLNFLKHLGIYIIYNGQGFRVKEGPSCVFSRGATARKSTQLNPSLTRKPCNAYPCITSLRFPAQTVWTGCGLLILIIMCKRRGRRPRSVEAGEEGPTPTKCCHLCNYTISVK